MPPRVPDEAVNRPDTTVNFLGFGRSSPEGKMNGAEEETAGVGVTISCISGERRLRESRCWAEEGGKLAS